MPYIIGFLINIRLKMENITFINFVCSIHVTLAMLASSATDKSVTQIELLRVLGRTKNLEHLEKYYESTLTDYEVSMEGILHHFK